MKNIFAKRQKVVLVTFTDGNYGTILQAYAMSKVLENCGCKVSLISSFPEKYDLRLFLKYWYVKIGLSNLMFRIRGIDKRGMSFISFKNNCLPMTYLYHKRQLGNIVRSHDIFITGSDQIWNVYHQWNPNFFLSFAKGKKKIAYSSSIGTNGFPTPYKNDIKCYLNDFCHIGVREQNAVKILSELTGRKDIKKVLDPVFLLSKEEWKTLSQTARNMPKKYMLVYLIGSNVYYGEQVAAIASYYECEVVVIPSFENGNISNMMDGGVTILNDVGPEDFVHLIRNASFVCTDSFHATCFSVLFHKTFVELKRFSDTDERSQNSRIYDFLSAYGLTNRMFDMQGERWKEKVIDYSSVQKQLDKDISLSRDYLIKSLHS